MAFFVEGQESDEGEPSERTDLELLAIGKKAGLSFEEINMFRVRDLFAYVNIITDTKAGGKSAKMATQDDIDAFYSRSF